MRVDCDLSAREPDQMAERVEDAEFAGRGADGEKLVAQADGSDLVLRVPAEEASESQRLLLSLSRGVDAWDIKPATRS